jgi:hypothetical protein
MPHLRCHGELFAGVHEVEPGNIIRISTAGIYQHMAKTREDE